MIRGLAGALLPEARKQIKEAYKADEYKDMFKRDQSSIMIIEVYENYTAAFGMIVNQSGFQSAFAMYNEGNTNSDGKKEYITKLLYKILSSKRLIQETDYITCKESIIDGNRNNYEELFKEASIALKRAIRTFEIVKK
jgi:hypothetical protein